MKKHLTKLLAGMLAVFALTTAAGCTEVGLNSNSSGTVTTATETTSAETTEPQTTDSASATIPSPDSATIESAASSESTSGTETTSESTTTAAASDNSDLQGTASSLFGALNYIEQIGSGNLPKDEYKDRTQPVRRRLQAVRNTNFQTADLCIHGKLSDAAAHLSPLFQPSQHIRVEFSAVHRCRRRTL
ncbi:MAG: hypothetical protein ACLUSL_11995 [Ruminococcus sp.]